MEQITNFLTNHYGLLIGLTIFFGFATIGFFVEQKRMKQEREDKNNVRK